MEKLKTALSAIDEYNRQDPNVFHHEGDSWPQEYFFSLKVYEWVEKLAAGVAGIAGTTAIAGTAGVSGAGEELLLAARAHHIGRWEIPRDQYPDGKAGYLNWRQRLGQLHGEKADAIMKETGYPAAQRERVKELILKKQLKKDAGAQLLENALCLVFLQYQYEEFRQKHPREKIIHVLKKSLRKMDDRGREEALKLDYSSEGLACLREALEQQ